MSCEPLAVRPRARPRGFQGTANERQCTRMIRRTRSDSHSRFCSEYCFLDFTESGEISKSTSGPIAVLIRESIDRVIVGRIVRMPGR